MNKLSIKVGTWKTNKLQVQRLEKAQKPVKYRLIRSVLLDVLQKELGWDKTIHVTVGPRWGEGKEG